MFHVVAANKHELASAVDCCCVHYRKARLSRTPVGNESTSAETANDTENNENSAKNDRKY